MNKKGTESEGIKFNWQIVAALALLVMVVVVALIIIVPRISSTRFSESGYNFGTYIWDILSGG